MASAHFLARFVPNDGDRRAAQRLTPKCAAQCTDVTRHLRSAMRSLLNHSEPTHAGVAFIARGQCISNKRSLSGAVNASIRTTVSQLVSLRIPGRLPRVRND